MVGWPALLFFIAVSALLGAGAWALLAPRGR